MKWISHLCVLSTSLRDGREMPDVFSAPLDPDKQRPWVIVSPAPTPRRQLEVQLGLQASGERRPKPEPGQDVEEPEPESRDRLSDPSLESKVNDLSLKEPECKLDEEKRRSTRRRE